MVFSPKYILLILYDMNFKHIVSKRHTLENEQNMTKANITKLYLFIHSALLIYFSKLS